MSQMTQSPTSIFWPVLIGLCLLGLVRLAYDMATEGDVPEAEAQTFDLPRGVVEGESSSIVVQFRDTRGNSQQPDSVKYWVTAESVSAGSAILYGPVVCNKDDTPTSDADCANNTPANDTESTMTIRLPVAASAIVDDTKRVETHRLNMEFAIGAEVGVDSGTFPCRNVPSTPTPLPTSTPTNTP